MRLTNVKNKEEILATSPYFVSDPISYRGQFQKLFPKKQPIYVEIGMGKGKFLIENALRYPEINFIGIEKYDSVLARCLKKIPDSIPNLKILRMDALMIDQIFDHEVSRIYLNFSDPWPKVRHHLRRLTSKVFLEKYDSIFSSDKEIYMRTDNSELFIYSLEQFSQHGYGLYDIQFDLHKNEDSTLITTEYEDKFSQKGMPIYSVVAISSGVQNSK